MTVTITNRQGISKSVNIGFEILQEHVYPSIAAMNADAANVRAGEFCMIATTDPTSTDNAQLWSRNSSAATSEHPFTFLSDLDQASSAAFADWLDNYKPVIEADHTRAEQDHTTASGDHQTATQDHATATTDHTRAESDHTRAEQDHTTAQEDHTQAFQDHSKSLVQTNRAEAYNDHPWEIRNDGFIWVWDEAQHAMRKTNQMIINFDDIPPEQQAAMVQEFLSRLVFDETPTDDSPNAVTSRGIKTVIDQKQDKLTFASDELCASAASEIVFV